jgi:small subunit ribosomal protein S21
MRQNRYNKYNKPFNKPFKREERPQGMIVQVRDGNVEKAIRVLKKKMLKNGIFQELRDRQYYESKGTKRRKAKAAATRRYKRKMEKQKQELGY